MMNTGNGLRLLIRCNYLSHHNWMSFISWFSIKKYLPDAEICVQCDRNKFVNCSLFEWVKKLNVDFSYSRLQSPLLGFIEIPCDVMAIGEWDNKLNIIDAKSNDISAFCTYRNGCGNFVMADWINSILPPFDKVDIFKKEGMTINEAKILEIWKKGLSIYAAIGES
jgi:hypothetical protein